MRTVRWTVELAVSAGFAVAVYEAVVAGALALRPGLTDSWILLLWMTAATVSGLCLNRIRRLAGAAISRFRPTAAGPGRALASVAAVAAVQGSSDGACAEVGRLLAAGTGARTVRVWTACADGLLRPVGAVPSDTGFEREFAVDVDGIRRLIPSAEVVAIADADGTLGALVVQTAARRRLGQADRGLIAEAADSIALLLRNRRLHADLEHAYEREQEQVASLTRSRLRLVVARDVAGERLGAELQRRVGQALAACADDVDALEFLLAADRGSRPAGGGVAGTADADGAGDELARGMERDRILRGLTARVDAAIADFREIVHGVYPAALTDHGLAPCLDNLVAGLPWPATLRAAAVPRLDQRLETSLYFCLTTAITALREAGAASDTSWSPRRLDLVVTLDHGTRPTTLTADLELGFAAVVTPPESAFFDDDALEAIGDRVDAMEGRLEVLVVPHAVRLILTIPVPATKAKS
jgi:hypothetical protein